MLCGNEHTSLARDTIYADLHDESGLVKSATLDCILATIRNRNCDVEGVTVKWYPSVCIGSEGVMCSEVRLDRYN